MLNHFNGDTPGESKMHIEERMGRVVEPAFLAERFEAVALPLGWR